MAQRCPGCEQTVTPVVTYEPPDGSDEIADCIDVFAGLHCPDCGNKFGESKEVHLDEASR